MQFRRPQPRQNSDSNLVPLINIVFLMLIFFMLAGRIAPSDVFAVTPPTSANEQQPEPKTIEVLITASGQLAVDGESISSEHLTDTLSRKLAGAKQTAIVTLKADAAIEMRHLNQVLGALRAAGSQKVTLLTARAD